jgi:hypothetical protein
MENAMNFNSITIHLFVIIVNYFGVPLLGIFALSLIFDSVYLTSNAYWGTFLLYAIYNKWFTFEIVYKKPEEN